MIQFKIPLSKALAYAGASGALIGSGCLAASGLGAGDKKYVGLDKTNDGDYDPEELKGGTSFYSELIHVKSKSLFVESLSKYLNTTADDKECKNTSSLSEAEKKKCGCRRWNDEILYDHIHNTKAEYIYYIKDKDNRKIRISPRKPNRWNGGIYSGWKLNRFRWKKDGKDWYGFCYPPEDENDTRGNKCDKLPDGWESWEI